MDALLSHGVAWGCLSRPDDAWQGPPPRLLHADAPVATWSQVWRYATLAVRADRRSMACVRAARATRARRFLQRYGEYLGACTLLYAARTADGKAACAAGGKIGGDSDDVAAWVSSGDECDPQFFAWLLAQTLQRAHADAGAASLDTAEPPRDSASAAHDEADAAAAALVAAHEPQSCQVTLVAADDCDEELRLRVALRSAPPAATAEAAQSAVSPRSNHDGNAASAKEHKDALHGGAAANEGSKVAASSSAPLEMTLAAIVQVRP